MSQSIRFISISNNHDIIHKFERFVRNVSENTLVDAEDVRSAGINAIMKWEGTKNQKFTEIYDMGERKKQRNIRRLAKLITQPITHSDLDKEERDDLNIIAHVELEYMFREKPALDF